MNHYVLKNADTLYLTYLPDVVNKNNDRYRTALPVFHTSKDALFFNNKIISKQSTKMDLELSDEILKLSVLKDTTKSERKKQYNPTVFTTDDFQDEMFVKLDTMFYIIQHIYETDLNYNIQGLLIDPDYKYSDIYFDIVTDHLESSLKLPYDYID